MNIRKLGAEYRDTVNAYVRHLWGGPEMVSLGCLYNTSDLPGFVAVDEGALLGAVLYRMHGGECEVSALFSLVQGIGAGTGLLDAVVDVAKHENSRRVWLVTTNDDTQAIRFYQRYGFSLKTVHIGALETVRRLKSGVPRLGNGDIPIEHEFEFEILF